jgi:hypothetical protein
MKQKRRKLSMKVKDGLSGRRVLPVPSPCKGGSTTRNGSPPGPVLRLLVRVPERGPQDQAGNAARGQSRHMRGLDANKKHLRSTFEAFEIEHEGGLYISRRALAHNDAAGNRRASTCGRPDIAAHPTNLSAPMRAAAAARAICGPGIRAISRHGN